MQTTQPIDPAIQKLFTDVFEDWRASRQRSDSQTQELDHSLWNVLNDLGLTRLTATGDGGWIESASLLRAAARVAAPVPLVENDLLALWLLKQAGLPLPLGSRTASAFDAKGDAVRVPWASSVDGVVAFWQHNGTWRVADLPTSSYEAIPGTNLAGEPRDTLHANIPVGAGTAVDDSVIKEFRLRGALARSIQMVGAMERAVELCVRYANDRIQFGRPISKFQAVQALIADAACEFALADSITTSAITAMVANPEHLDEIELRVGLSRSVTGHASSVIVRNAHQVHGAMGATRELELHEFTKPLQAWRSEFGSVHSWDATITSTLIGSAKTAWDYGVPAPHGDPNV